MIIDISEPPNYCYFDESQKPSLVVLPFSVTWTRNRNQPVYRNLQNKTACPQARVETHSN